MQFLQQRFIKLIGLAVLIAVVFFFKSTRVSIQDTKVKTESLIDKPVAYEPRKSIRKSRSPANRSNSKLNWESFKKKYGEGFEPEYNEKGELIRITAKNSMGNSKSKGFSTTNKELVIQRINEILTDIEDLVGLQNELPLQVVEVQLGAVSSQVSLREQMGSVPIYPMGTLTIDLGPDGQLLGMSSSYLQTIQPVNDRSLTAQEATMKAGLNHSTEYAQPVIWAAGFNGPFFHAYQYQIRGQQVIIDASSGNVIYKRDRRQF
jgi:hypothetical protein